MKRLKPNPKEDFSGDTTAYCFSEYIQEKEARGLANRTLQEYEISYNRFMDFFGDRAEYIGDITAFMFVEWINSMKETGIRASTINHHVTNMRTFFYWCMDSERKYLEPFKIKPLKSQEELPKDYTQDEMLALLEKPKRNASFVEWRTWAICNFVIGTGARLSTFLAIRMRDINLKEGKVIYQHTKNKKAQVVNIPPQLVRVLKQYIDLWRYEAGLDDYLFCRIDGEELDKQAFYQTYRRYAHSRGVNKSNIHGLRHTFAREWFINGGDIVQLSKVLGHSSLAMSMHYMNIYADSARDRFIQFNPLENVTKHGTKNKVKRREE